jgi:hypothetical protein
VKAAAKVRLFGEKREAKSEEFANAHQELTIFIDSNRKISLHSTLNSQLFRTFARK